MSRWLKKYKTITFEMKLNYPMTKYNIQIAISKKCHSKEVENFHLIIKGFNHQLQIDLLENWNPTVEKKKKVKKSTVGEWLYRLAIIGMWVWTKVGHTEINRRS